MNSACFVFCKAESDHKVLLESCAIMEMGWKYNVFAYILYEWKITIVSVYV